MGRDRHDVTRGLGMDKWSKAGWVVLAVGLLLLAYATANMGRDVEARTTASGDLTSQSAGPVNLPGGSYTIWVEDHTYWPDETRNIIVSLNASGDILWGEITDEKMFRDIEGARCFIVGIFDDVPAGEYLIDIDVFSVHWTVMTGTLEIFVLTTPGSLVLYGLVGGATMAVVGTAILVWRKWPGKGKM
jgi:hypothetical protein